MNRVQRAELQRSLTRLADGDRTAFRSVFESVWPLVRRFAARLLPSGDAEDAAQEALLKVFARASEFDPQREALPWILGCVAYECRTLARKKQRRREEPTGAQQDEREGRTPEEMVMMREMETALVELLGTLSLQDRETILAAMQEREGRGGATFRKRLQRALVRLREAWRLKHGHQ